MEMANMETMTTEKVVGRRRGRPAGQSDVLEPEEIKQVLDSVKDRRTAQGSRDYAILLTLANTPMRRGELVRLNVEDVVDRGQKSITYKVLKKRSGHVAWMNLPISDECHAGITAYLRKWKIDSAEAQGTPLFYTLGTHGGYIRKRLTAKAVDCLVSRCARSAGILKRITCHSWRATYLTIRAGKHDPQTLMGLSGHSSLGSILPYLRSSEAKRREAALSVAFA